MTTPRRDLHKQGPDIKRALTEFLGSVDQSALMAALVAAARAEDAENAPVTKAELDAALAGIVSVGTIGIDTAFALPASIAAGSTWTEVVSGLVGASSATNGAVVTATPALTQDGDPFVAGDVVAGGAVIAGTATLSAAGCSPVTVNLAAVVALLAAPTVITFDRATVPEFGSDGFVVGTPVSDVEGAAITVVGTDGGLFGLEGSDVVIADSSSLDFETAELRTVRLRAETNGGFFEQDFAVGIGDVPSPVASAALPDVTFVQGSGVQTVNAAADFAGITAGVAWSVTGAGASISDTGLVSIPTGALLAGALVTVTASHPTEGSDSSAFQVDVEAAGSGTVTASTFDQNGVTYTLSAPATARQTADGAWVVRGPVTVQSVTPAPSGSGAAARSGLMLNPLWHRDPNHVGQPWDGRSDTFDAATQAALPLAIAAGDVLVKAVSTEAAGTNDRQGWLSNVAALYCLSPADFDALPAGDLLSPAPVGWTGRASLDFVALDLDAALAAIAPVDVSGHASRVSYATIAPVIDRWQGLAAYSDAADLGGYEAWFLYESWAPGKTSNYGQWLYEAYELGMLGIMGTEWTDAEKKALIRAMAQVGVHLVQLGRGHGDPKDGDGGHHQWQLPCAAMALLACPGFATADELRGVITSNALRQSFIFTQPLLDRLVPHDSDTEPYDLRQRAITAKSGNTLTINMARGGERYRWHPSVAKKMVKAGGIETTLAAVQPTDPAQNTLATSATQFNVTDASAFAVGDTVWFEPVEPFALGDPAWTIQHPETFNTFDLSPDSSYMLQNNQNMGLVMFLLAAGLGSEGAFEAFIRVQEARAYGFRGYAEPFQHNWAVDMWNGHGAALFAATVGDGGYGGEAVAYAAKAAADDVQLVAAGALPTNGAQGVTLKASVGFGSGASSNARWCNVGHGSEIGILFNPLARRLTVSMEDGDGNIVIANKQINGAIPGDIAITELTVSGTLNDGDPTTPRARLKVWADGALVGNFDAPVPANTTWPARDCVVGGTASGLASGVYKASDYRIASVALFDRFYADGVTDDADLAVPRVEGDAAAFNAPPSGWVKQGAGSFS